MFRRVSIALAAGALLASLFGSTTLAAEPFASCGSAGATKEPPGFGTTGFAHAALVYAGSIDSHSANPEHAVAQYDIACVHFTSAHP